MGARVLNTTGTDTPRRNLFAEVQTEDASNSTTSGSRAKEDVSSEILDSHSRARVLSAEVIAFVALLVLTISSLPYKVVFVPLANSVVSFSMWLFGMINAFLFAIVVGVTCCSYSWMINYYDSFEPGMVPPSPVSPAKFRRQSGHTFHLGYTVAVMNGVLALCLAYWWSPTTSGAV